jgi:hypothetical protein
VDVFASAFGLAGVVILGLAHQLKVLVGLCALEKIDGLFCLLVALNFVGENEG